MHLLRTLSRSFAIAASAAWMFAPSTSSAASYTCLVSGFNVAAANDGSGNLTVNCTAPTPTSSCVVTTSTNPNPLTSSGGTVTVTASNCGTITGWTGAWGTAQTPTPAAGVASFTDQLPLNSSTTSGATYSYTVNPGTSSTYTASVTVPGSTPPPPPSGGTISCAGYTTQVIDIPWGAVGSGNVTAVTSRFTNGMIVVGRFTTPNVNVSSPQSAKIGAVTYVGNINNYRTAALSQTPCDFPSPNPLGRNTTAAGVQSPNFTYQNGGTSTMYAVLQPNTTYYLNIKNEWNGAPTCPAGASCDMQLQIAKAKGW